MRNCFKILNRKLHYLMCFCIITALIRQKNCFYFCLFLLNEADDPTIRMGTFIKDDT